MKALKKILRNFRIRINKIGSSKRSKLVKSNYTLISNNCWGGLTYEYLGKEFLSPTIGLYFMAEDYIKFIANLKKYIEMELKFIDLNSSRYKEYLVKNNQSTAVIGLLGDIEIIFLHYKTPAEAKEKWDRRKKKINYNKIIYKFNDQNLCTEKELEKFNELDLKNKICFTAKKYDYQGFIQIKKYKKRDFVKDDAYSYHKYFDIVSYINKIEKNNGE